MGENYASKDQLKVVGLSCHDYDAVSGMTSSAAAAGERSCETCENWTGTRCSIDVFDKVLTGLDQT